MIVCVLGILGWMDSSDIILVRIVGLRTKLQRGQGCWHIRHCCASTVRVLNVGGQWVGRLCKTIGVRIVVSGRNSNDTIGAITAHR